MFSAVFEWVCLRGKFICANLQFVVKMMGIFGQRKTIKEIVREQKRMVDKSIRELERERMGLQRSEAKLILDIKKAAKNGKNMKAVEIMAKDLVRIRKNQTKFIGMVAQLRGISLQMTEMKSTLAMQESMKSATRSMMVMNRKMNLPALQRVMMEFQKQTEKMAMQQEVMSDAVDDALEDEDDEEEQEAIVGQVLDELNINLAEDLDGPKVKKQVQEQEEDLQDQELEARLANLKR
jgi:charged multivesicular body protein 2A